MTRWMELAHAELGVHETAGAAATPAIVEYFHDAGRAEVTSDETAWCAAFVNTMLVRAGVSIDAIPKEERLLARACLKLGVPIEQPRYGAVAVFKRGKDAWSAHVTFVTGWDEHYITGLGGNQSNGVTIQKFPRLQLVGLIWPEAPRSPMEVAKDGSRIAKAAIEQKKDAAKLGGLEGGGAVGDVLMPPIEPAAIEAIAAKAGAYQGAVETLERFASFAIERRWWVFAAIGLFWLLRMAWRSNLIAKWRAGDANEGKTT